MTAPDSRLIFRNTMKITPGHADQFRQAMIEAVEFAEAELSVEFHPRLVGYLKPAPVAAAQDAHR